MLSLIINYGQSSVYNSFPDSDAIWSITYGGYLAEWSIYSYTLNCDTAVNSFTFKFFKSNKLVSL